MSQSERLYQLRHLLSAGRAVTSVKLCEKLGVSNATLKRDLAHLRDRMNAPLVFDKEQRGYLIDPTQALPGTQYELPGLWFNNDEICALLTMQHLLARLDTGGLLGPHIAPLMRRLSHLLGKGTDNAAELTRRIQVRTLGARRVHLPHFQALGGALLQRRRLHISYQGRERAQASEREISPQRLVHYRDNWYLEAWCHWRRELRSFSVDAIRSVRVLDDTAKDVPEEDLDAAQGSGYGIFAGRQLQWATLRFSADRARWVAAETWHPQQRGRFDAEGRWLLDLPYADPRELVMDILRHVPEVEVISPDELGDEVRRRLELGLQQWRA